MGLYLTSSRIIKKLGIFGNDTVDIPKGFTTSYIVIKNTTSNAVTGGIKIGTTAGGTDVILSIAVGSQAYTVVLPPTALLKQVYSYTTTQTLYIQAVTAWNSAVVDIYFCGFQLIDPNN